MSIRVTDGKQIFKYREMDKVLNRLEGWLDRITAVIHSTSAQERLLAPAAAAEMHLDKSAEDSSKDFCAPVLQSSLEEHRIVNVEPAGTSVNLSF